MNANYHLLEVTLTQMQSKKLIRAMEKKEPVSITVSNKNLQGGDYTLMLTKAQMNRVQKALSKGTGAVLKLSPRQLKASYQVSEQTGTGFFQDVAKFIKKNVPKAAKAVAPIVKPLVKPVVGALAEKAKPGSSKVTDTVLGSFGLGHGCPCPHCNGTGVSLHGQPLQNQMPPQLLPQTGRGKKKAPVKLMKASGVQAETEGQLDLF